MGGIEKRSPIETIKIMFDHNDVHGLEKGLYNIFSIFAALMFSLGHHSHGGPRDITRTHAHTHTPLFILQWVLTMVNAIDLNGDGVVFGLLFQSHSRHVSSPNKSGSIFLLLF